MLWSLHIQFEGWPSHRICFPVEDSILALTGAWPLAHFRIPHKWSCLRSLKKVTPHFLCSLIELTFSLRETQKPVFLHMYSFPWILFIMSKILIQTKPDCRDFSYNNMINHVWSQACEHSQEHIPSVFPGSQTIE